MAISHKIFVAGWLFAAGLACGCSGRIASTSAALPHTPHIFYANQLNNNQTISLEVGDELVVYLPAINGGRWQLAQSVSPGLINRYPPSTAGDGTSFYFIANAAGTERASFQTRAGTGYTSAGSNYDLRVDVAQNR